MQNLGNKVSRVLDPTDHSFSSVVYQPLKPPLDSEWNLVQAMMNDTRSTFLKNVHQSGFLKVGDVETRPSDGGPNWKNVIKFKNPVALVNGWLLHIGGGTNQFPPASTDNIWKILSNNPDEIVFICDDAPQTGSRDDLIFLEVWEELVTPNSQIYKYGFVQSGVSSFSNDLIDPNIKQETSLRTQVRYRIRHVEGVDFITYREGIDHPAVYAQGAKASPVLNVEFEKQEGKGHYRAGDGVSNTLGTVDGYVYAIPLFAVHRKNKTAYSVSNPNGAGATITDGISDRPDGAFNDEISLSDIEDLRHLILLDNDLQAICDESLLEVLKGSPNRLGLGITPQSFSKVNVQIDGISVADRPNISESLFRRPNGYQRSFSDKEVVQRTVLYINSGTLNGDGELVISPPEFYTNLDTTEFQSLNPFIGGGVIPAVYNATTGDLISADSTSSLHFQGWRNLGDRLTKGAVFFKPFVNSDILGKPLIVEYDLVVPAGTGLTNVPNSIYKMTDDLVNKEVAYTVDETSTVLLARTVNGFQDEKTFRPISSYINQTSLKEKLRAGTYERVYHVKGNNTQKIVVPNLLTDDNQQVLSVLRVQFATNDGLGADIPLGFGAIPKVLKKTSDGSFEITFNNYFPAATDTVRVTLLMAGVGCEITKFNKGVNNFVKTITAEITSTGVSTYTLVPSKFTGDNQADFIYAVTGLYDAGSLIDTYCYVHDTSSADGKLTKINNVNFESDSSGRRLTIIFSTPVAAGKFIRIPLLVSFAPTALNEYTVTYDNVPYNGLSNVITTDQQIEAEIVYVAPRALITTCGTGGEVNSSTNDIIGASTRFPKNYLDKDAGLANGPLLLKDSQNPDGGNFKFVDYHYLKDSGTTVLQNGQILQIKKHAPADLKYMERGGALESPLISYAVQDLLVEVEEDITNQFSSGSNIFRLKYPVASVLGTSAFNMTWKCLGQATFTQSQTEVLGLDASFLKQLKPGFMIRPVASADTWYRIASISSENSLILMTPFALTTVTSEFEVFFPDFEMSSGGYRFPFEQIKQFNGIDKFFSVTNPPAVANSYDQVKVKYKTALNTMNILYGLALGKGILEGELLLFTLTSTSSIEPIDTLSTFNFNLLKQGSANKLIFNNNLEITTVVGDVNEGNRVVIAADLFYTKNRRVMMNQKV